MDLHQSPPTVPFPLAAITSPANCQSPSPIEEEQPDEQGDIFRMPAITHRARPQPYQKLSHASRNSSFSSPNLDGSMSRRASAAALQSFLEGVEFATRVGSNSRRGESRAASRQTSIAGQFRSPPQPQFTRTLADEEEGFLSDLDETEHHQSIYQRDFDDDTEEPFYFDEDEDGSPRVFDEGDRIGVGMVHHNSLVQDCFEPQASSVIQQPARRLEIVRKLGSGSYAVVYLARALLWDPEVDGVDSEDGEAGLEFGAEPVYGQEFALKCLSKHNLSEDMLQVQKFEATLHEQVPAHPNIVAMHGAFETDSWLFLVLEYCPGQDLFYWLEQAKDHEDVDDAMHPTAAFTGARAQQQKLVHEYGPESYSATPPSPTLLSITTMSALLSRRRLRLISRMFQQMCDAVQACHDRGISHRDIKPENFICCEDQKNDGLERRVTVKIMDWGLGTTDEECGDFDCGSKPYMAYECRNNLAPTYLPKGADIWSLGIVLLNLLFHRCPWSDPSPEDADFRGFCADPEGFLLERFQGISSEVARYLAEHVLNCEGPRVSAGEFGSWAGNLVRYMSDPTPTLPRTASVSQAAVPLEASHHSAEIRRLSHVLQSPTGSDRSRPRSSLLSQCIANASDKPSPVSSPPQSDHKDLPAELNNALRLDSAAAQFDSSSAAYKPSPLQISQALPQPPLDEPPSSPPEIEPVSDATIGDAQDNEAKALAAKAKRRKRGARRGRSAARAEASEARDTESRSRRGEHQFSSSGRLPTHSRPTLAEPMPSPQAMPPAKSGSNNGASLAGRFKGAFKNGNSDLEGFMQRSRERDMALSGGDATASAPAKMQGGGNTSSLQEKSFGTNSTNSYNSWGSDFDTRPHWNSTAARRERLGKRGQQLKPASSEASSAVTSPTRATSRLSDFSTDANTSISEGPGTSPPPPKAPVYRPPIPQVAHSERPPQSSFDKQQGQASAKPLRPRPEPPSTATQEKDVGKKPSVTAPPKPKSGFFKGLFR